MGKALNMLVVLMVLLGMASPVLAGGALPTVISQIDLHEYSKRLRDVTPGQEEFAAAEPACPNLFQAIDLLTLVDAKPLTDKYGVLPRFPTLEFYPMYLRLSQDQELTMVLRDLVLAGQADGYSPNLSGVITAVACQGLNVKGIDFSTCDERPGPQMYACIHSLIARRSQ